MQETPESTSDRSRAAEGPGADGYRRSVKEDEFFLITRYVSRRLAYPAALLFRKMGFSANAVTILGGCLWMLSVPVLVAAGVCGAGTRTGWGLLLLAAVLWNAGYFLDVVDGSLARLTGRSSPSGFYLDFVFHLLFNTVFLAALGVFLYLATGRLAHLVLAVFSPCCNWGLSFSAKEHVLCEEIARRRYAAGRLSPEEEYFIFIDSPKTKRLVGEKRGPLAFVRHLAEEIICFPGQFTLLGAVVLADWLLRHTWPQPLILLQTAYALITAVMLMRVPFRIRREFRTLRRYEDLTGARGGGA